MTTQTIKVEGLPEGWKAIAYRVPKDGESYFYDRKIYSDRAQTREYLIVEKIQPRRIVLESTREKREPVTADDYFFNSYGNLRSGHSLGVFEIWKQVKETDIPLTNEEPKLSLSVDECRNVRSLIKDFENLGWFVNPARSLLLQKITEFIKDK